MLKTALNTNQRPTTTTDDDLSLLYHSLPTSLWDNHLLPSFSLNSLLNFYSVLGDADFLRQRILKVHLKRCILGSSLNDIILGVNTHLESMEPSNCLVRGMEKFLRYKEEVF